MKGRKTIVILTLIIIILIGIIYNFIKKDYLNNEKIILKTMSGIEYEDSITSLNQSHDEYVNYIKESKIKIANAITDMGVDTAADATIDIITNNIKSINNITKFWLYAGSEANTYAQARIYIPLGEYKTATIHYGTEFELCNAQLYSAHITVLKGDEVIETLLPDYSLPTTDLTFDLSNYDETMNLHVLLWVKATGVNPRYGKLGITLE